MLRAIGSKLSISGDYRRSSLWTDFPSRKGSTAAEDNTNRRVLSERRSSRWAERFSAIGRKMMSSKRSVKDMSSMNLPDWREKHTIDGFTYYHNVRTGAVSWAKPDELKTEKEKADDEGDWVWVPHPVDVWQPGKRIPKKGSKATEVKILSTGDTITIPVYGRMKGKLTGGVNQEVPLWPLKLSTLSHLEDDLVMLEALNEGLLMHVLRERYKQDKIYTWVGSNRSVLVSINPFKTLDIYGQDAIDAAEERSALKNPPPHVYGIASDSLESLIYENRNQSILISGESGAGKTQCTKQCLDFLAMVAGAKAKQDTGFFMQQSYGDDEAVEQKVLVANPVLEAFGNAMTIRNNNSSRFGKWIEVHIDRKKQVICGAKITSYLLERTRVVIQQKGERNYHIFYQLCANESARETYELGEPESFHYLNQSGVSKIEGVDDNDELEQVTDAMLQLDFDEREQEWLMRMSAGILHLGNVTFAKLGKNNNMKGSTVKEAEPLEKAAKYLGVVVEDLSRVLTERTIVVKREMSTIHLDVKKAKGARDSIAKAIYGRLFQWLVDRINTSFGGTQGKLIGILDIFGFEIFEHNSFEQLCINYCNEKLQQHFNDNTFRDEEELYIIEDIKFKHVDFDDNQPVLDLIEKVPGGILPMLDDEGVVPGGTEARFYSRMVQMHRDHPKFHIPKDKKKGDRNDMSFIIDHYAHKVKYSSGEFMLKNSDTLFQDMYTVIAKSEEPLTQEIFPDLGDEKRIQIKSIGNQFRTQLNDLMNTISKTQSRFIRTIKPNAEQVADNLNSRFAIDQLRSSGVFQAVNIRREGFPFRYTHEEFAQRYRCINVGYEYKSRKDDYKALCREILYSSPQKFAGVQIGSMRVLYRVKDHKVLKLLRNLAIEKLLPKLQAAARGYIARKWHIKIKDMENRLQEAIEVGNDVDELESAIEYANSTMDEIEDATGNRPTLRNYPLARGLKKDLKKWIPIEEEMDNLELEEPEEVVEQLKDVIAKCEKLMHIPMTSNQEELYEKMKEMLATQIPVEEDKTSLDGEEDAQAGGEQKEEEGAAKTEEEETPQSPEVTFEPAAEAETGEDSKTEDGQPAEKSDQVSEADGDAAAGRTKKKKKRKGKKKKKKGTPPLDEKGKARHAELKSIDKEARTALAMLDRDRMQKVYERAKKARQKTSEIREIRKLLGLSELDFAKRQYERAVEHKDKTTTIHRQIRVKQLTLKKYWSDFVDISTYPELRTPAEFAASTWTSRMFNKERNTSTMLQWTDKKIPTSLTRLPPFGNKLLKKAILSYISIQTFMGDRALKGTETIDFSAKYLIGLGLQNPLLCNEIFMQIIKQLTKNPNRDSRAQGWKLLKLCMSAFKPGDDIFENYLVVWITRNVPKGEDHRHYTSAMHAVQYGAIKMSKEKAPDLKKVMQTFNSHKNGSRYSIRYEDDDSHHVATEIIDGQPRSTKELNRGARESIIEDEGESPHQRVARRRMAEQQQSANSSVSSMKKLWMKAFSKTKRDVKQRLSQNRTVEMET